MSDDASRGGLPIHHADSQAALEAWLEAQPDDTKGVWLAIAKQGGGAVSVSKAEAIDSALCFGWIDGQLGKLDERHFLIRYTPRRARSKWSENNVRRAEELIAAGRMRPRGQAEIDAARADGRWDAAYPPASRIAVPDDLADALAGNAAAAAFFAGLSGANRYAVLYRLHGLKLGVKRAAVIATWVEKLARHETVHGEPRRASMTEAWWNDTLIAKSDDIVTVEGNAYFPREAVTEGTLSDSPTTSVCPWKGTASYYTIHAGGAENKDAAWYYPEPKDAAKEIKGRVAFWKGVQIR